MKQETKILPVALSREQRTRLKWMATEKAVAMTELVRWWIDEKWSLRAAPPKAVEMKSDKVFIPKPAQRVEVVGDGRDCKICGKPSGNAFLCKTCEKL